MSTSSSGSGSTNHSTNPTPAKHQLVSPEGFLRPVEGLPEGVTKLVIYVGGDKEKLQAILGICERINSVRECMDLSILRSASVFGYDRFKYLIFNFSKDGTFSFIAEVWFYKEFIQKKKCYEVSYDLFIGKLRWAERALLFQDYVEKMGLD